ncbi:hypothetical protein L210DRAFT_2567297 [Boletus edulis BED1]|uniref:Uncharacterized protein n=1 Tax=Boletus edulis BED1 TaxID=1328754 RepID=A0AAD4BN65_BOLED|nr:hypothetical protein L210DRAFT_2567297 [Boletus edulis BED1]
MLRTRCSSPSSSPTRPHRAMPAFTRGSSTSMTLSSPSSHTCLLRLLVPHPRPRPPPSVLTAATPSTVQTRPSSHAALPTAHPPRAPPTMPSSFPPTPTIMTTRSRNAFAPSASSCKKWSTGSHMRLILMLTTSPSTLPCLFSHLIPRRALPFLVDPYFPSPLLHEYALLRSEPATGDPSPTPRLCHSTRRVSTRFGSTPRRLPPQARRFFSSLACPFPRPRRSIPLPHPGRQGLFPAIPDPVQFLLCLLS